MDYVTWVNQDIKQSYRYKRILKRIEDNQQELDLCRRRLESAENGEILPEAIDKLDSIFSKLNTSLFDISTDVLKASLGVSQGEIYVDRLLEQERRKQVELDTEQRLCKTNIAEISSHIEELRKQLKELERTPILPWFKLPPEEWDDELAYRVMDNPYHFTDEWPWFDEKDLNPLFRVIEELQRSEIDTVLKTDANDGWTCTMSLHPKLRYGFPQITVTRRAYDPADALKRTALTLLDLAWQQLIDRMDNWNREDADRIAELRKQAEQEDE